MKLLRAGPAGQERPALLDGGLNISDLLAQIADVAGAALSDRSLDKIRSIDPSALPEIAVAGGCSNVTITNGRNNALNKCFSGG
jgi:2,4-diketo-3-deoxy-L-fuconate hydrolase